MNDIKEEKQKNKRPESKEHENKSKMREENKDLDPF